MCIRDRSSTLAFRMVHRLARGTDGGVQGKVKAKAIVYGRLQGRSEYKEQNKLTLNATNTRITNLRVAEKKRERNEVLSLVKHLTSTADKYLTSSSNHYNIICAGC